MNNDPIFTRRSIRKFLSRDIPKAVIEKMLEAAVQAPSAKNRQPWRFIVLSKKSKIEFENSMENGLLREEFGEPVLPRSREGIQDAKNTLRIMKEAPILIVVINTNGKSPFIPVDSDDRLTEICDSLSLGAAIQNLLLTAEKSGLGTLWIANTCFAYPELCGFLHTDEQLVGVVAAGYAAESPAPRPRKKLSEIVEFLC